MLSETFTANSKAREMDQGSANAELFRVVQGNQLADVQRTIESGADPNAIFAGKALLRHAGELGHLPMVERLVAFGADPDARYGKRGYSLLHGAVIAMNYGFANMLLQAGADPSPKANNGATPLHFACRLDLEYLTLLLLRSRANPLAEDKRGKTPRDYATDSGCTSTLRYLPSTKLDSGLFELG